MADEVEEKAIEHEQPRNRLSGFDPRSIFESAPGFEQGEGQFIIGGESRQVLSRMAACFLGFRNREGRMYFRGVTVIAPPRLVWDYSDQDIHAMLVNGLEDIQGAPLPAEVLGRFVNRVSIHRCLQLDADEVVTAVDAAGDRQVILIAESGKYRTSALEQEWSLGRSGALLSEDIWVPHAAQLAKACVLAAKPHGSVIVFSATEDALVKQENVQLLTDVELLYPVILSYEGEANTTDLLSKQLPQWVALAAGGLAQQAFEEIDNAGLDGTIKRQVELQVAARAGDRTKVLAYLQDYLFEIEQLSSIFLVRLGRLAHAHGDIELAHKFFAAGLDELNEQMSLEVSLLTVTNLGAADLVERYWTRLHILFPQSKILQENREFRLLQLCDAASTVGQAVPSRTGFEDFHTFVADTLTPGVQVDYEALIENVRLSRPDQISIAAICAALHALGQQNLPSAIDFAVLAIEDRTYEPQAARVLLGALRRMFLLEAHPTEGMEAYKVPLLFILQYLGRHPEEAGFRAGLASALSVESAGAVGLPVLASLALDVSALGMQLREDISKVTQPADEEEFRAFFARAIAWMAQQRVVEPGVTRLPSEMVGNAAASLIAALERLMRHAVHNHEAPEDLVMLEKCVYMVCLLHPYAPEHSSDLDAFRLLAAKFWLHGQPQRARDIAEQMLTLAGNSLQRQRLAWGNYADIYQRMRNPVDALIGLTCATLTEAQLSAADLFQETYTLVRVTRDLHLYGVARSILPACRRLYEIQGLGEMGQQRLDGIEIALDVAQSSELDEAGLLALLGRAQTHCESVLQGQDEPFPAAAQFLQIAGAIERTGNELPVGAVALREALRQRLGADTSTFLNAISTPLPNAEDVVWLYNRLGAATNSEDAPADQMSVVIAAHRLLLPRTPDISAEAAAVAAELLSDHAVELAGPVEPLDAAWPVRRIRDLSQAGLGILMLASDSDGELVAVVAEDGQVRLVRLEARERSFEARLNAWGATYPYRYGLIERNEGNGEFYASMQEFEVPMPDTDNVLIIAQPSLQQLAFNLVLKDGNFVGASKAIGMAPSLTWFEGVRQQASSASNKRHAWISCSPQSEAYGTLDMLFARLAPVFDQHGFTTDTSGRIPTDLRGASMAVVTAHGQLTFEQRYIHSIADERKLTESPLALARALAEVELVILFVCSGGRVDRHPMANTTVSLPKMLLDRGCRAVVASPWPLAAAVPGNWLEYFLEAWETGDTVLVANFKANLRVQQRLGPEPSLGLAMTVYGDVLLTKRIT